MKFRSGREENPALPGHENIHVSTTAGHTAIVGPEWRELPAHLHAAAIKAGCEVDKSRSQALEAPAKASAQAVDQSDEATLTRKAIKSLLKRNDPDDFTLDGIPKVAAVVAECGFTVGKTDVMAAWQSLQDEAAK